MTNAEQLEKLKLESFQIEIEMKKTELAIKQRELKATNSSKRKISLERATIYVAIIGFIGSFIANTVQGFFSDKQKKQEFESALITKAVENGDSSISRKNLKFLLDAGLITDKNGKIKSIVADTSYILPEFNNPRAELTSDYVFMTPGGSKYHLPTCRIVQNLAERVGIDKAKELDLQPCKICHPPNIYNIENQIVQCMAITSSGSRCRHMTRIANGYCFQHQPK